MDLRRAIRTVKAGESIYLTGEVHLNLTKRTPTLLVIVDDNSGR